MKPGRSKFLLRIVVTVALVLILVPRIEWKQFSESMVSIDVLLFCLFVGVGIVDRWLMAFKWNFLLKVKNISISNLKSFKLYMIGGFFGEFLPTGLGVDLYRIQALSRQGNSLKDTTSSVVVERILGLLASAVFATAAMSVVGFYSDSALIPYVYPLLVVCAFFLALPLILINVSLWGFVDSLLGRYHSNKLYKKAKSLYRALIEFKENYPALLNYFLLSIMEVGLKAVFIYVGSRALGLELEFVYFIALVPALFILLKIPISIQGIGVQEGLFIFFFSLAGMTSTDAFSLAFIMRLGAWAISLIGAAIYFLEGMLSPDTRNVDRLENTNL